MRALLAAATLLVIGAASALNLVLGAVWAAVLLAILALRRRVRWVDWGILLLTLGVGAAGLRLGWLAPPALPSYALDEVAGLAPRTVWVSRLADWWAETPSGPPAAAEALWARLRAGRFEELRYAAGDLERRAAAAVATARQVGRLTARAPAEAAALEEAARRLALTLTAPEFRDLQSRRARLEAWFAELEAQLTGARDDADLGVVAQGLEPAAIASVSFRALREDLARVDAAAAALVRVLTGGGVRVTAASRAEYDELAGQVIVEDRYVFTADPPLRITRLDVGGLRLAAAGQHASQTLSYGATLAEARQLVGPPEIALAEGAPTVVVIDRRAGSETLGQARSALRPLPFPRLTVSASPAPPEFGVTVAMDPEGRAEARLVPAAPGRGLEGIRLPRYAFHYASLAGRLRPDGVHDVWVPVEPERAGAAGVEVELVPATPLLRNPVFTVARSYLYTPSAATALALTGLAALAAVLTRRPRATPRETTRS